MKQTILIAVVVVALAIIGWAIFGTRGGDAPETDLPPGVEPVTPAPVPAPPPERLPSAAEPAPAEPLEPEIEVPPLTASDEFVQQQLEPLELPEPWLAQGDLARRFAVVLENAARGEYPRRQLGFMAPTGSFTVIERDDAVFVDPVSYERYDAYVDILEQIEPEQVQRLITLFNPLFVEALQELDVDAPPDRLVDEAIRQVMAVPVPDQPVELVQPAVMFEYADPALEALTPLQKQILRMGPDNVRRLQEYLGRLESGAPAAEPDAAVNRP